MKPSSLTRRTTEDRYHAKYANELTAEAGAVSDDEA
jgi:hypothetical protein